MTTAFDTEFRHLIPEEMETMTEETISKTMPRIFLADDQEEMLQTIAMILEDDFWIVGTATNGVRVLELAPELHPDVLVLDISMPLVNGLEAALRLRETCSSVKVIFLTIHDDHDFVEAAKSVGALGYVLKPHLGTDLIPAIRKVLEGDTFVSSSLLFP